MESSEINKSLEKFANAYVKDIKNKTRGRRIKFVIYTIILLLILVPLFFDKSDEFKPHVVLVRVDGVIAADAQANAERINKSLDDAYKSENTKAVIVEINSPGGSPVQSDDIYEHMVYLQNKYPNIPMYSVCTDVCASGGYYIAAGAKTIYANKMTITGSIGVIGSGFGFTGLIDKLGIDRRVYTSGESKDFLDPFQPQKESQTKEYQKLLNQSHQVFIDAIKGSRGDRLKNKESKQIFSGEPFSGIEAQKLGLIDGFASIDSLKIDKLNGLPIVNYTQSLDFVTTISNKLGSSVYYSAVQSAGFSMK